ncbi:hypothetical protein P12x_005717 [Tundrisphaera lichenicola]|uniref:hypothetical protein n=1 Tax=Tundrisphaera lichenicola TaxID=2029860 RepID=UPI003EBD85BB
MSETYSAILRGDRLEWLGASPELDIRERGVKVDVTIVPDSTTVPVDDPSRMKRAIEALERLAARGTFSGVDDSVHWQREIRRDRPWFTG